MMVQSKFLLWKYLDHLSTLYQRPSCVKRQKQSLLPVASTPDSSSEGPGLFTLKIMKGKHLRRGRVPMQWLLRCGTQFFLNLAVQTLAVQGIRDTQPKLCLSRTFGLLWLGNWQGFVDLDAR